MFRNNFKLLFSTTLVSYANNAMPKSIVSKQTFLFIMPKTPSTSKMVTKMVAFFKNYWNASCLKYSIYSAMFWLSTVVLESYFYDLCNGVVKRELI